MARLPALFAIVWLSAAAFSLAADFEQIYYRDDGTVLLHVGFDGRVAAKNSRVPWDAMRTGSGVLYYQCHYQARNRRGEVVNQQVLWHFPRAPAAGNTDASNYWVYWHNPKAGVTWGRCPTRSHPNYAAWRNQKGEDLWQIVPKGRRPDLKGVGNLRTVARLIDPAIIGSRDAAMPKVAPETGDDEIFCIDLDNTIFI